VRCCREILLADLPVDWIVVLEQEERAGQRERIPGYRSQETRAFGASPRFGQRELRCPR